jgi:hypothetical protein
MVTAGHRRADAIALRAAATPEYLPCLSLPCRNLSRMQPKPTECHTLFLFFSVPGNPCRPRAGVICRGVLTVVVAEVCAGIGIIGSPLPSVSYHEHHHHMI